MLTSAIIVTLFATVNAFGLFGPSARIASSRLFAQAPKPTFDGTLRMPGEHPETYVLENDNGAKAIVRTHGGNAFTYITADGIEVMGKRKDACDIKEEKIYAGGNPHCFPQFGPGAILQHGFARGMAFIPEERAKKLSFDRMIFKLVATEETRKIWDHNFEYRFDVTLRADCLEWDVIVINLEDKPFDVTLGLHTYLDVSSLKNIKISGPFSGKTKLDRTANTESVASSDEMTISAPTDVLFKNCNGPVTITDTGKGTKTTITQKGYSDVVVWSPYGNDAMGYDKFICVEPVQSSPVSIPPGKFKETKFYQKISCTKL